LEIEMKKIAFACAALLAGSLSGMAHASTTIRSVPQQVVSYADLNLESATDAAILFGRIEVAARNVCGLHRGPMPLELKTHLEACAAAATARAVNDVNAPLLTRSQIVVRNIVE
jgi:UrcA family protein